MNICHRPLILFILKKFHGYGCGADHPTSNGLTKSATFVVEMLREQGHNAILEIAIDQNSIDRIVTRHRPDRVVLEAIWVTPAKLRELKRLHPHIRWTVRIHSEIPFLANEGSSIEWTTAYMEMGVEVGFNSSQTVRDFEILGTTSFLPNYYPLARPREFCPHGKTINVGCFGAIRPLKNQLMQAFAAIRFADRYSKHLIFHMNSTRLEQYGENNLRNIKALFKATRHELHLHPWCEHRDFLKLVAKMDICLQVSLSESFNIVSADAVSEGVPLIGSTAIAWLPNRSQADPSSSENIAMAMSFVDQHTVKRNFRALRNYLIASIEAWNDWVAGY